MAKKCPSCQKFVNDKVITCPFCGSDFGDHEAPVAATAAPQEHKSKYSEVANARGNRPVKKNGDAPAAQKQDKIVTEEVVGPEPKERMNPVVETSPIQREEIEEIQEPVPEPVIIQPKNSWMCNICGTENTTKFCGECGLPKGAQLDDDEPSINERNTDNTQNAQETYDDINVSIKESPESDDEDWDDDWDDEDDEEFDELLSDNDPQDEKKINNVADKAAALSSKLTGKFAKKKDIKPISAIRPEVEESDRLVDDEVDSKPQKGRVKRFSKPTKVQEVKEEIPKDEIYDPNEDHYYDDVIPAYEAELERLPKEVIIRFAVVAVAIIATIIAVAYRIA